MRLIGPGAITAFAVLHGAGNGLLTIAKGTVPLAIFGPVGYGLRSGILGAPARATQAASPLLFGLLMDHMGIGVLAISAGLSLSAFVRAAAVEGAAGARAGGGIAMALAPGNRDRQLCRMESPLPDIPGQENGRGGTG